MASPFPTFGGGTGSFPTFGGAPVQAHAGHTSLFHGNILGNLLGDVGGFFAGLPAGLQSIGTAGYHAAQGHPGELGAIAAAVGNQYKHNYYDPFAQHGGLLSGSGWQHLGANLYNHPLAPILDVATLFTGGGAAAGKLGASIAKGAEVGSAAARIGEGLSGLKRLSAAEFKALPMADRATALKTAGGGALVPESRAIMSTTGAKLHEFQGGVSRNPVIRARQALTEQVLAKTPEGSFFHPDVRGARLTKHADQNLLRTELQRATNHLAAANKPLSKPERVAAYYRATAGIDTPHDLKALIDHRTTELAAEKTPRLRSHLEADLKLIRDNPHFLAPTNQMKIAENAAHVASDKLQMYRMARGAGVDATPKQIADASARVTEAKATLAGLPHNAPASTVTHHQGIVHSREAALKQLAETRATLPRRVLGLSTPADMRLAIASHSEGRLARGLRQQIAKSTKGVMASGEDLHATGMAFRKALHNPDLMRIGHSLQAEVEHTGAVARYQHLMQVSKPYAGLSEPERAQVGHSLQLVHADSALARQVGELTNFLNERVAPLAARAGDTTAADMTKMLNDWMAEVGNGGMVIPRATLREMTAQTTEAVNWLQRMLKTPTRIWRDMTLSLKGSFYVNNFLGNVMLGFISYGPQFFKELLDVRSSSARGSLGRRIDEANPTAARGITMDVRSQSLRDMKGGLNASHLNPLNLLSQSADAVANLGAKFTESNFRRAAFAVDLKRMAKGLAKADGISERKAIDAILNDSHAVDALSEKMYGDMLDYSKLTPFEKNYMRTLLPFWNFQRAITGRALRLTLDEPWKVQVMGMLAHEGDRTNHASVFKDVGGQIPGYLSGLVPIGKTTNGKTKVFSSYAANPFSAVSDEAGQLGSVFGADAGSQQSPFAQFNPYIKSAIEAGTKQNLFFGTPLAGSRGSIYASQLASNFPQLAAYNNARYPNSNGTVQHTLGQRGLQYAGANIGTFDAAAQNRQNAINAYYANLAKIQAAKAKAKHDARDLGGISHVPFV